MAALMVFTVGYGAIRLKVRLLPTIQDVHREYIAGRTWRRAGMKVHAFFQPAHHPSAKHTGTIVLPADGRLEELIPHEVVHAVMGKMGGVHWSDDEALATAVGVLSARIHKKINRGVAA
ncbi:MAG: hypothetical protein Q7S51_10280 [Gallionellaceae bacterium]|nr:hypothetical protein [Gallionellaceae bacterium]